MLYDRPVNRRIERRYFGFALLLAGAVGGATAVLLLEWRRRMAIAEAAQVDHDMRASDMAAEGGAVVDGDC